MPVRPPARPLSRPLARPFTGVSSGGGGAPQLQASPEASAFLARTTGLNEAHRQGYITLINTLVAMGLWSTFDVLYITATQDSTTACLNLISSSFTLTPTNSPTFTADRGFTGTGAQTTYVATSFTPSTQSTKASQDNACAFGWSRTSAQDGGPLFGDSNSGGRTYLFPRYTDDTLYGNVNSTNEFSQAATDGSGLWAISRGVAGSVEVYRNGVSFSSETSASTAFTGTALRLLSDSTNPSSSSQIAAFGYGSNLTAAQQALLYNAVRGWMALVGAA